ncbi:radical SAM protein [Acetobacter senegalensis]|uniref:radical SAM protein n=1 Tax=Acetobacter senegalensis TaxID=446692 RepID=UPI00209D8717|nr:radical SAM protein [Acetobacter senegalensis]
MSRVKRAGRKILGFFTRPSPPEGGAEHVQTTAGKPLLGFVDQIGLRHIHGWIMDPDDPVQRLLVEAFLPDTGESLGTVLADQFHHGIAGVGDNSRAYGFWFHLKRELSPAERERLRVRVPGRDEITHSPQLASWQPLLHVAMDIVNNCNLRCPFCLYDYSGVRRTNVMTRETLEAALRLMPYTKDGEFWFSCLHEPSLHPDFLSFLNLIPNEMRNKVFFTSNIARRMPASYFQGLARSGIDHINISIESRTPEIYERMRKGARFPIFMENWDKLLNAFNEVNSSVALRYIIMAYKSNLHELPDLARYLIEERRAAQVEIRYTYDVPFIDPAFREQEFLTQTDWDWLQANLPTLEPGQILLDRPPVPSGDEPSPAPVPAPTLETGFLPGRYLARLSWDGTLELRGISVASTGNTMIEVPILTKNVRDIGDPETFFNTLDRSEIPA